MFSTAIAAGLIGLSATLTPAQTTQPVDPAPERPATAPAVHNAKTVEIIEVTVGESRTLDAVWPVKRVSVADPKIAEVDASAPSRVEIQGKAVGITELALENEQGEVWRARIAVNADTGRLQSQLRKLFANSSLEVAQIDDIVVVKGTLARAEDSVRLRNLLTLAKMPFVDHTNVAGLQQVQLQVKVAEVSRTAIRMLGVNAFYGGERWFGGLQLGSAAGPFVPMNVGLPAGQLLPGQISTGALQYQTLAPMGVPPSATLFAGFPNSDLQVFIQALAENQYLRLLAEPTLVARSGQEAHFLAGGEFPLPISQLQGGETQISIEYKEFGIRLNFTPTVLGDGRIELRVRPEVSELSDVGAVVILGTRVPSLITRRVETTLELQSGQTFAIAGLIDSTDTARVSKIPGLGDLPVLGSLFRSVRYNKEDTEMVILVTASLIEPSSNDLTPPLPGEFHKEPNDWELYLEGRSEGRSSVRLAPVQKDRLQKLGLDKLHGPGAWVNYDAAPNTLAAQSQPADEK
jgi:pilus assembly protein CpaC